MIKGTVFNIQKFSINDGPGIRTTVFLKGCPLKCIWCHNPESNEIKPQIFYNIKKCRMCGRCSFVCPNECHIFDNDKHIFKRENCNSCGLCAKECFFDALENVGEEKGV